MISGFSCYPLLALWAQRIQDGWERMSEHRSSFRLGLKTQQFEQDGPTPATVEPQLQLSTRLHPQDPKLEDLTTAAEFPHRFNTRLEGHPDQVEWLEQDAATGKATWHAPVAHRLHSLNSREICYINVANRTAYAVRMLWLDYQGNEVAYETIAAGDVLRQQTFLTHPWMVREVTTGTQLLLNGREAFVPSQQEHQENVAAARARQQAVLLLEQQQALGMLRHNQQDGAHGFGGAGGAPSVQVVVLAGTGSGCPLFEVTVGELPQLHWTKETHRLFPASFKRSSRAFLLSQQKQQRELYDAVAAGSSCLGHIPTELLPVIIGMSAPDVPQGVHYPTAGRLDIKPARLSAAPPAAARRAAAAAAEAPAGPLQQQLAGEDAAAEYEDA